MKDYTKHKRPEMLEPFFPNEIFRHIIVSCFFMVIELIAVIVFPLPANLVIKKPDHIPWFLLPVYKLNKLIHHEALFISLLILFALLFISWPFLVSRKGHTALSVNKEQDTRIHHVRSIKRHGNLWQNPIPFTMVIVVIISVVTLCFINL